MTNYGKSIITEFKSTSTIGVNGVLSGSYCNLTTITPWGDSSGGLPVQVATNNTENGKFAYRTSNTAGTAWSAWQVMGAQGFQGPTGPNGTNGTHGKQGPQGPNGTNGTHGKQGPQGPNGTNGTHGKQGPQGPNGTNGTHGKQGPQGPTGPGGSNGTNGKQGAQGPQGPTGPGGSNGTNGKQGPQGPKGDNGTNGKQGPQGPTGPGGSNGTNGKQGAQGPQGPTGPQGKTGPQGPTGGIMAGAIFASCPGLCYSVIYTQYPEAFYNSIYGTPEDFGWVVAPWNAIQGPQGPQGNAGSSLSLSTTNAKCYLVGSTVATGTINAKTNSNVYMSGGCLYASSDERLKDFVGDVECDLDKIKEIPKKYFTWKNDNGKSLNIGTSAQKLREIYPELVTEDKETGELGVGYSNLSIVALAAIDKLNEENQKLKEELESIKERLKKLEDKLQ